MPQHLHILHSLDSSAQQKMCCAEDVQQEVTPVVPASLRSGNDIALGLDRPCPQEELPVRFTCKSV